MLSPTLVLFATAVIAIFATPLFQHHLDHADDGFNDAVDKRLAMQLGPTTEKLSQIGERLARLEGAANISILQRASAQPDKPESAKQAIQVFNAIQHSNQQIEPDFLASVGKSFIDANRSYRKPDSWQAALSAIDYRTKLNFSFKPTIESARVDPKCMVPFPALKPNPNATTPGVFYVAVSVTLAGSASPDESAKMEPLNRPNPACAGAHYIIVEGRTDTISLDGMYLKNVVIENATVAYDGGPVKLENVLFVNCKIQFSPAPRSRDLGTMLLTSTAVSFSAKG